MIIGNGLMANAFKKYLTVDDTVIFACGVSDSKNCSSNDFIREEQLLYKYMTKHSDKKFVYFSTCAIYDTTLVDSLYVQHKLRMEDSIKKNSKDYLICRLSNMAGFSKNNNTILNFLYHHIYNRKQFNLRTRAQRNILDVSDAYLTIDAILQDKKFKNKTINIANIKNYPILDIVQFMENLLGIKAHYATEEKGSTIVIDTSDIEPIYRTLNIGFDLQYLDRTLAKYYSER